MRSPDAEAARARCLASIPDVFRAAGLPAPREVVADTEGWVNPCFFVDGRYVVRFNARDPDLPKQQRERVAYRLAAEAGLPVPTLLFADTSHTVAPHDVMIAEKLPGENLEQTWPALSPEARDTLAFEAGALLARLHTITLPRFGSVAPEEPARHDTWSAALRAILDGHIQAARAVDALDPALVERLRALIPRHARALDAATPSPHLVHADFHFGNLLHHDGHISAVLDFEWCFAGPPVWDTARLPHVCPQGGAAPALRGYRSVTAPTPEAERMTPLYTLTRAVEMLSVCALHFPDELADDQAKLLVCLREAEQLGQGWAV